VKPVVRIATINILNDLSRWNERRSLLAEGLAALSLDLIALQEVTNPLASGTAHWLAETLTDYELLVCPKSGWGSRWEGLAILSRLPVSRHVILDLRSQQRTAQLIEVDAGECHVAFINGHFFWLPGVHGARVRQVRRLLSWIDTLAPSSRVIVCGDFNATPISPPIRLMKEKFVSAHEAVHGCEPKYTCPTPLICGGRVRGPVTSSLLRLFSNAPGESWRGTLDYIFVSSGIQVIDCEVILDRPSPHDPTLYASDHFGLAATLALPE
jgi:endonuclease/exonuclease/phosphatase family metal-dependent hydrolase